MLKIYTSEQKAKELSKLDIAPDIEARFKLRVPDKIKDNAFRDELSTKILKDIEGMKERKPNGYIDGKFGDVQLQDISTGGKGVLLAVNYRNEFMINIDELGYNCIYLLFEIAKEMDIEVISTRVLYHMKKDFNALINNKLCHGRDISREMERCSNGIN